MSTEKSKGFNPFEKNVAQAEDEGIWIDLNDEVGDPMVYVDDEAPEGEQEKPVRVLVAGTYSERYRKAEEARANRVSKRSKKPDGATLQKEAMEMIVSCVLDWDGFIGPDPKRGGEMIQMPCERDNVFLVLKKCPWIREQVESTMQDHERFSKRS